MLVCPSCFGESDALRAHFKEHGKSGTCPTCGSADELLLEASELSDLFDGLKEYYEPLIGDLYRLRKDGIHGMGEGTGHDTLVEILREDWPPVGVLTKAFPSMVGRWVPWALKLLETKLCKERIYCSAAGVSIPLLSVKGTSKGKKSTLNSAIGLILFTSNCHAVYYHNES